MSDIFINPYAFGSPDDFFAQWRLDETSGTNANDSSLDGLYDGTYVGSPTLGVAGKRGTAVTFDGTDDYLAATTLGTLGSTLDDGKAIEFWVKTTQTAMATIFGVVNTGTNTLFSLTINTNGASVADTNSGKTELYMRANGGTIRRWSVEDLPYDGEWHHVVIVCTNTSTPPAIYVDGWPSTLIGSANVHALADFGFPMAFGARNVRGVHDLFFAGSLDNIIIHKTALTADQVQTRLTKAGGTLKFRENWSWWTRPRAVAYDGYLYVPAAYNDAKVGLNVYDSSGNLTQISMGDLEDDDHNNGAILIQTGQPPILFYSKHGTDNLLRYRIGTDDIENVIGGIPEFGAEQTLAASSATYAQAFVHGTDIYIINRVASTSWRYYKSTDWGQTWGSQVTLVTSATGAQLYMSAVLVGDILRCATSHHPITGAGNQAIYYFEANLDTLDVTTADGTSIGTLGTSIDHNDGDLVYTVAAGNNQWVFDVGDGTEPEIVFMEFDADTPDSTGVYRYAVYTGGSWVQNDVIASGKRFVAHSGDAETYYGGIQIARGTAGSTVYATRYDSPTWKFEKHVTADDGATWTPTVIESLTSTDPRALCRVFPIEGDASVPWDHVGVIIDRWTDYTDFNSRFELIAE